MKRQLIAVIVISFFLQSWGILQAQVGNTSADRLVQAPISGLYLVPAQSEGMTVFDGAVRIHNYGQASLVASKEAIPSGNPKFAGMIPVDNVHMVQYRSWKGLYQSIEDLPISKSDQVGLLALVGPIDGTWSRELEKYGIDILDRAPPYGLVVSASTVELLECRKMVTSSGFQVVRGWVPMPIDAKISSDLMPIVAGEKSAVEIKGLMTGVSGNPYIRVFPYSNQDRVEVLDMVSQFAPQVRGPVVYDHDNVFEVAGSDILNIVETLSGVAFVEGVYKRTLHNNLAVQDYIMNIEPVWGALGWDGTGVIVGHNDSGADLNHPDLAGVILATNGAMSNTDNGHGTHTAGSVAGRGGAANSPNNTSGCGDQSPPLNLIIGAAPGSQLVVNNIFDGGSTSEDLMMRWGYQNNSVLSTNSWGYGTNFTYSSNAATVDARVRDADTTTVGNQEYSIIFSAGNSGPGSSTVGTPGNGKNTLTVGASQNDRCGSYIPGQCAGASIDLMACFSSRGPAQSRILPDVVGVGTDVISVESSDSQATYGWDESWTGSQYALSPGTSMSCPLVAGATAVFFEFYASTFGSYPSPALSKAAMINGAVNIGTYGIPSFDQGWGRVDLRRSIEGPPGGEIVFVEQSSELTTGGSWSLPFTVGSTAIPLKISMDWTDPPGAANCSSCLVNDLDLVVTSPSGTVYKGNQFNSDWAVANPGGKDNVNNVECVYVEVPETGNWTMQVVSANTAQNPQGLSGQDFAVVYSGSFCSAQAPTGLTATPNGNNQIDLSWNAATGSTEYRIYRSTTPGGPYTQIATRVPTNYSDTTVSGSVTYYYVVTNYTNCESGESSEASALATGTCTTGPTFSGLQSVTNAGSATCTLDLAWNVAISPCGNGITYNIYRSTDSGFTPAVGNRIVTGSAATSYSDSDSLTYNVTYYYVARAVDSGNGAEDTNTTRVSGVPTGPITLGTWFDNVDSYANIAAAVSAGYTHQAASGSDDWAVNIGLDHTTGSANSFRSDSVTSVTDKSLVSPAKTIAAGAVLSFWHRYDFEASGTTAYDGGVIEISTNGGSAWTDLESDITANGYGHTMSSSFSNPLGGQPVWSGTINSFVQVSVDLANYVGGSVLIRWRLGCDSSTSNGPWYIDDIQITNSGVPGSCSTGGSCTDPGAPVITSISDNDACAQDGVTISYTGGSGASSHDLYDDGSSVVTGFTSGSTYNPGDSASHSYVIRAIDATCFTNSSSSSFTDATGPGSPSITSITDDDSCVQTGIHINFNAGSGATSHSLWRDGSQVVANYTSGVLYNPGNAISHSYVVRAIKGSCTADSSSSAFTDSADMPGTPSISGITDDDSCIQSGIHVSYNAGSGASSHDLLRNGSAVVIGYVSGALYNPGGSTSYSYSIRAVTGSCTATSGTQSFTDAADGPGTPSISSITDDDSCAQTGIHINYNSGSGATSHSLWRDGSQVDANYGSGDLYNPGDTGSHSYIVRAINGGCTADSASSSFTDTDGIPTPAAPGVSDLFACALSGVQISWSSVSGATSYDILVDGSVTLQDVTSPHTYNPVDSNSRTYQVRGRSTSCNGSYSVITAGSDFNYSLSYPGIGSATDRDSCDDTGVVITWSVPASWNDGGSGSRTFTVYRGATNVSGPLSEGITSYVDIGGTNGTSYNYSVVAENGYSCTAGSSTTLAATDVVGSMPTFAGVQSVNGLIGDVCGLRVAWSAATSNCGSGLVYNVYRATTSGFTPNPGTNMIASCVSDLYYDDTSVSGLTTYYYVVRAEDSAPGHGGPCNDGFEDSNSAEANGTPGGIASQQLFFDDYDGNRPANPDDYYIHGSFNSTAVEWHQPETHRSYSTTNSYNFGPGGGADYADDQDCGVVIGGDGTGPSGANGFAITSTGVTLSFYHTYDLEASWDGVALMYSTTGPLSGYNYIPDTVTTGSPYITTGSYTGTISGLGNVEAWNGNHLASWTQVIVNLDELNGQTVWFLWRAYTDGSVSREGYYFDDVKIEGIGQGNCSTAPSPVEHFTARSTGTNVKLEWQNPTTGYGSTHIRWDTSAYPADATSGTLLVDQVGTAGNYDTTTHSGLTNGTTYYYSVFVDDGSGEYSARQTVVARPFDTATKVKWAYQTSASSLAPPGVYPGAAGVGAAYVVSNDRVLHSMNSASSGGDWPRSAPFDWLPMGMNGPAQARPPIVPTTIGSASLVAFLGSLDGHIYAVNARSGQTLWQSAQNYTMVQGSAAGIFTGFGGAYDLIFAGSRIAGSGNSMHAMNPADGTHAWSFGGTIGIISSGAIVDYANSRLYFTSRQNPTGSADTLWCISFTGASASLVWSKPYGDIDSTPVLYDGVLYVGNNSGEVLAVNPNTGATIWSFATGDGPIKGYVNFEFQAVPRQLLFTTSNKVWSLIDHGATVSEAWQQNTVGGPSIPLTLANQGMLYIGSTDGKLYQVDTSDGSIVTSVSLGAGTATVGSPSYDYINSMAYIGTEDGSVYAVTLPLQ